ncbi:MAG: LapA family protein [Pseudomonadota bacterium]
MFRYLRYLVLVAIALVLVVVALANRGSVTLNAAPDWLSAVPGLGILELSVDLPLFLVIFAAIAVGVIIGYVWEWAREHKHRVAMRTEHRENVTLKREVKRLKGEKNEGKDDVLALLDDA